MQSQRKSAACVAYRLQPKRLAVLEHDRAHAIGDRFTLVDAVFEQIEDRGPDHNAHEVLRIFGKQAAHSFKVEAVGFFLEIIDLNDTRFERTYVPAGIPSQHRTVRCRIYAGSSRIRSHRYA